MWEYKGSGNPVSTPLAGLDLVQIRSAADVRPRRFRHTRPTHDTENTITDLLKLISSDDLSCFILFILNFLKCKAAQVWGRVLGVFNVNPNAGVALTPGTMKGSQGSDPISRDKGALSLYLSLSIFLV